VLSTCPVGSDEIGQDTKFRIFLEVKKMRKTIYQLALAAIAIGMLTVRAGAQAKPANGFDQLKTLVGTWESAGPDGKTLTNTIRLVSNGTALEETFQSSEDDQMVTLYSPDGNRLALTHYCSAGNQPRMETHAITGDQKEFDFSFTGITNLKNSDSGHMHHLVIQIPDQDHFTEQWTWHEKGKDRTKTLQFTRRKT
jgi:hypothetical protein